MTKILIAAPISGHKQYSMGDWLQYIADQSFANYDVCLCVNGKQQQQLVDMLKATSWTDVHNQEKKPIILWQEDKTNLTVSQRLVYARETIRRYFLDNDYTHLLWLDTDTIPLVKDAIQQLLSHEKPYVSGLYHYKKSGVVVAVSQASGTNVTRDEILAAHEKQQLIPIVVSGFGCCLIERATVERAEFNFDKFGTEVGDDYGYCYQLDQQQIERLLDPLVVCKHLGDTDLPVILQGSEYKSNYEDSTK